MMNFANRLNGLSRPIVIEAVYLTGRYLRHALTWDAFQRQLQADVQTENRDQSVAVVHAIPRDIEAAEGTGMQSIPMECRAAYLKELNAALWRKIELPANEAAVEDDLVALRAVR
jgi:hypothetical protein